jgi:hypothetical protein
MMRLILSSVVSSSSSVASPSAALIAAPVRPPWLLCASSMMMAKFPAAMLRADAIEHERESLHRGNDDLLAVLEELRELLGFRDARAFLHCADDAPHLREALDRLADLLIEDAPVGDDDDRVERLLAILARADELVRQPCDGVGLPAAR